MRKLLFILLSVVCCPLSLLQAQQIVDLAGIWDFCTGDTPEYNDHIMLPGSMLTNDKGADVTVETQWTGSLYDSSFYFNPYMERYRQPGQMKFPFFLTPKKHYVGNAWYRRTFYVPQNLKGERLVLFLERPHIETTVFINGQEVGHQMSLSVPHRYDVTKYIRAGERNEVAIRVYNGIEHVCVGQDSHSVTDQTQGNWNGIVGRIELQARPKKLNIKQVHVVPNVQKRTAKVLVELENHTDGLRFFPMKDFYVTAEATPLNGPHRLTTSTSREALGSKLELELYFGETMLTWDEFDPVVYQLVVRADEDVYETQFGMREISIEGRQLYLNGQPIWMRGTVENCTFPDTGFPPTDEDEWLRIFRKCKEYGINHVRFHSYCPPEAAFCAADIAGIYLQPEGPSWPNHGVRLRRGMAIDQYLLDESKRIIDAYGNHPSFVMMAAGNEPAGDWVSYCNDWVKEMKRYDPTKVYCGASVGGGWAWDDGSEYHVKGGARGLDWDKRAPQSSDDYYDQLLRPRNYKGEADNNSPIIAHEQGQWCAFPDFKEIPQYSGAYKAANFELFRDLLRTGGMASQAEHFLMASGKLQTLCYKYEIERNLRTKDYAGFQLLGLNDYSGQGTALVGPLNVFWREKGYVDGAGWREFCSPVVPLARFPRFIYTTADTLLVPIEMYNAYKADFRQSVTRYAILRSDSSVVAAGTLSTRPVPRGKNIPLGTVRHVLRDIEAPAKLTLRIETEGVVRNHWEFWVYPDDNEKMKNEEYRTFSSAKPMKNKSNPHSTFTSEASINHSSFYITDTLDAQALKTLRKGGKVLLCAAGKIRYGSDIVQHYLPVFWNTSWFKMRPPHTTGAYIQADHPMFRHFPTDEWSNLNWWELLNRAQVINMAGMPANYQSPVQPIDTWHLSRRLGMVVEANVLRGKLLLTTLDLTSDLDRRIVARQLRQSVLSYMQSDEFQPAITLQPEQITRLFTDQAPAVNMFTNDSPDELKPKIK